MLRRKLQPDGSFGPLEKVFDEDLTPEEQIENLGQQLVQEKIKNLQKDMLISNLGQQVALLKIEIVQLKGGEK